MFDALLDSLSDNLGHVRFLSVLPQHFFNRSELAAGLRLSLLMTGDGVLLSLGLVRGEFFWVSHKIVRRIVGTTR